MTTTVEEDFDPKEYMMDQRVWLERIADNDEYEAYRVVLLGKP